jgi:hypothetical protein
MSSLWIKQYKVLSKDLWADFIKGIISSPIFDNIPFYEDFFPSGFFYIKDFCLTGDIYWIIWDRPVSPRFDIFFLAIYMNYRYEFFIKNSLNKNLNKWSFGK